MYVVLKPDSFEALQLFLTKNGVVLVYDDIPAHCLKFMDQLPTIAANVMRPGRGHALPSSVTGGTWPEDITWNRAKIEKGVGFTPGGDIPDRARTTAWEFMGQRTPENYVKLVFGHPLSMSNAFDPKAESIMNILGESPLQGEESQDADMTGGSPQGEEPTGSSPQGKEPGPGEGSSLQGEAPQQDDCANWWETPGEPSAADLQAKREAEIDAEAELERNAVMWPEVKFMKALL